GAAVIFLIGHGSMLRLGMDAAQSRTAIFITLILGLFGFILANRHPHHPLMAHSSLRNRWLRPMFIGMVLMLALSIGVPYLRGVMALALPTPQSLAGATILLVLTFLW